MRYPVHLPDVNDYANRPHIQRSVVTFVFQHFRGQVGRRAHHRATERPFTDYSRESEIAQLHL